MHLVRGLVAAVLVTGVSAGPLTQPPAAEEAPVAEVAEARRTGQRVEIEAMRSETRQVFAQPDGTHVMELNVRPVRVRQAGQWAPVDTTLKQAADGTIAPVATAVGLTFSGGGSGPLARMSRGAKTLELGWPGALPTPTLNGGTATYPEVMPGVDLQVTADVDGFSHVLVVKSRAAAAKLPDVSFPLATTGLSMKSDKAGNLEAVDRDGGTVFTAATPTMWDSSAHDGRQSIMAAELAGRTLRLKPDRAMLADPKTRYPVYLDPFFSAARGAWTAVWKNWPDSNYLNSSDVARVGKISSTQTNRSFFQMNTGATIHGKQIIKATLRTYETWAYSCSARVVEAWATNPIGRATTWDNQPAWVRKLSSVNVAKGWSASCAPGGVEFDVTSQVADAAAKKWPNITVGLRAASESDVYAWKKFKNNPALVVEYNSIPGNPVAADVWSDPGGACATGTARPTISTVTPKLWARLKDADNSVKGRFEWWTADGVTKIGEYVTGLGGNNGAYYAVIPQGAYTDGSVIRWRARAEDGRATSAWSPWCEATVDSTAPGKEPVVTSSDYAEGGWSDGVGRAGTFTFAPNGVPDVVAYVYGLDTSPNVEVPGPAATVVLTPRHDGPNVLSVRSKDRAGQLGPIRSYVFNVKAGTPPDGHWKLDEGQGTTAADAAATPHPATLYGSAAWTTGKTGAGLRLDGVSAYAETAAPVISTARNFTVAAWVKLTSANATSTALAQQGGFSLQYSKANDRWALTGGLAKALSAQAPRLNEWTHLTGVYESGRLSLYVNGRLESTVAGTPADSTGPLTIGRAGSAEYFPGDLDDVRVHGRAMFAEEVAELVHSAATLVGHWKLDDGTGATAADSSGRATPATLGGGASWTTGWLDDALAFDGSGGHAETTAPAVSTRGGFTVAFWTQLDYLPAHDTTAVSQSGNRASGFQLGFDKAQGRWAFGMATADTDTAALAITRSDAVPVPLEWTHVAGVYDPLDGQMRVYVNGRLSAATVTDHVSAWNALGPLHLGRAKKAGVFTGYWPGIVDDVRVYDGVLSAEHISQLAAQ
ncbi:LamG-like jellyroll fold domain-containing protein [Nonomuraea typhae]|uniref:LamG-like jellyroll fold domain-containing protein n=1 Tax=Nonomuraea typhae TaxID=2603600 RepID=UPI0012F93B1B|nr:LamG-like jellyroll fold domain-containing protein [Nonomuraea typhae]